MSTTAPPRYEPQGWIQWPAHPQFSVQFLRILGAAQEGAATISECFQAASRIIPPDSESWYSAWQHLAQTNARRATAAATAGRHHTARANFLRASLYSSASEFFLRSADPRRAAVSSQVAAHSRAYLRLLQPSGEAVSISLSPSTHLDAYFLKPAGLGVRWPAVICFGGLDSCKDELLPRLSRHALERGLALLLIDMPGQGENLRLRGMSNRADAETPVARCVDYLQSRSDVNPDRIAVYGASLGGVYAARAASAEHRLKAAVSDSLVFDLHAHLEGRLEHPDPSGWDILEWVFGCSSADEVLAKSLNFRMANFLANIRCPYLIVQGECDFLGLQTALDAFEFSSARAVAVDLKVFGREETGASHCQSDNPTLGQEFICDWLAAKLDAPIAMTA